MEQYLVTIEFRYSDAPKTGEESERYISKKITIGVFDTRELANEAGNKELDKFEAKFKMNPHYNKKERFSMRGGCFGSPNNLVTGLGYIQKPFDFYAKIERLKYGDIDEEIDDAISARKRYVEYKRSIEY